MERSLPGNRTQLATARRHSTAHRATCSERAATSGKWQSCHSGDHGRLGRTGCPRRDSNDGRARCIASRGHREQDRNAGGRRWSRGRRSLRGAPASSEHGGEHRAMHRSRYRGAQNVRASGSRCSPAVATPRNFIAPHAKRPPTCSARARANSAPRAAHRRSAARSNMRQRLRGGFGWGFAARTATR